jgi:hypothetical protein
MKKLFQVTFTLKNNKTISDVVIADNSTLSAIVAYDYFKIKYQIGFNSIESIEVEPLQK